MEDDITASVVVPAASCSAAAPARSDYSLKFVQNCEYRLFQRPDDAIHRGYDKQTEADFAHGGNFFSNYEPLTRQGCAGDGRGRHRLRSIHRADAAPDPAGGARRSPERSLCRSAHPRLVDGKPTKNPRYLQTPSGPASTRATRISRKWPRACTGGCRMNEPVLHAGGRRAAGPPQ